MATIIDRRQFIQRSFGLGACLLAQGCLEDQHEVEHELAFRSGDNLDVPIEIIAAVGNQPAVNNPYVCSIPASMAEWLTIGDQVRIVRDATQQAIYTVVEIREQDEPNHVRLGIQGRLRLGTSAELSASLRLAVVTAGLSDAEAQAQSEFVERLVDDGDNTGLLVLAPHGGMIESRSDRQAERVAALLAGQSASSWICKGWRQGGGAFDRWHVTSTAISPNSFPALATLAERGFAYALAFHGMASEGVLIGGAAPYAQKLEVHEAIVTAIANPAIPVTIVSSGAPLAGDSPTNLVNWLTADGAGGIQLEQGPLVRNIYWQQVADAMIELFEQWI